LPYLWTCPFCDRNATIDAHSIRQFGAQLSIDTAHGYRHLAGQFIVCPNPNCREFTLDATLYEVEAKEYPTQWDVGNAQQTWKLIPASRAKPFPNYIPPQILQDYREACLIVDLSPKASATLSRRCLQGMIRNFWGITDKPNLKQEIDELKGRVDGEMWKAIDAIRKVGKIGAHMEKDVDLIVDVEPHEAEKLIGLIELLLKEWYVAKHEREEAFKELAEIGEEKNKKSKGS
jgi:hypothetical protein